MRTPLSAVILVLLAVSAAHATVVTLNQPARVAVRFDPGTTAGERAHALRDAGLVGAHAVPGLPGVRVATAPAGMSPDRAASLLEREDVVRWADVVGTMHTTATPNDPLFGQVWGLAGPDADANVLSAWNITTGSRDVAVAVVDSGVAPDHPDLTANLRASQGRSFVPGSAPTNWADQQGHGTHVSGTIGAVGNNGLGVAGVNWQVGIIPVRSMNMFGSGDDPEVAAGAAYAADHARVVNMSIGGGYTPLLVDVVTAHPNTLFVVAAGNDATNNDTTPSYPCALPNANLICVASTTQSGGLSSFSSYGATTVDLGAPGSSIQSTEQSFLTVFSQPLLDPAVGWTQVPASRWHQQPTSSASYTSADLIATVTGTTSDLTTPVFVPLAGTACRMEFAATFSLPLLGQSVSVHASADGVTWDPVFDSVAGRTNGFENFDINLSTFDGRANVRVRFRVQGPAGTSYGGAHISYVRIVNPVISCVAPEPVGGDYGLKSGTSMATPAVAGAAALLLSNQPSLTVAQLRQALLSTVTPMSALQGITVTGGRLNVAAALASIQPPPTPAAAVPAAPTTPMALTLRGTQPVPLTVSKGKVKPPLQCRGTAAGNCVMTIQILYWVPRTTTKKGYWKVIGSLKTGEATGWTGTKAVALNAYGKNLVTTKGRFIAQVRTTPRDGTTGLTTTGRVRITS